MCITIYIVCTYECMYHRERILETSTLSCNEEEEKITKQGWERNFVPKKFRGIDSERFPLFRGRKCSFRGIPSSAEEPIPKLGTERNGAEFREKMKFYGTCIASLNTQTASIHSTLSSILFRGMVWNGIPRVCFYFCSTERNSGLFSLLLKSSEGNSESLLLFWYHGTEPSCFLFRHRFRKGFRDFASIFVQRNGIPK